MCEKCKEFFKDCELHYKYTDGGIQVNRKGGLEQHVRVLSRVMETDSLFREAMIIAVRDYTFKELSDTIKEIEKAKEEQVKKDHLVN